MQYYSENMTSLGRSFLDRREFLGQTASGLSAVALASLLDQDRLLADTPKVDPSQPHSPRKGHFDAKAKNVLVIFVPALVAN